MVEFRGLAAAEEAERIHTEMIDKLAQAAFENADFYRWRGCLVCAVGYFEEAVVLEYPTTDWAPRALLAMYHAYEEMGWAEEANETAERLLFNFPESEWAAQLRTERDAAGQGADNGN
jgi:outer membrane protein assembly factor BamD (BamD/ComL family)